MRALLYLDTGYFLKYIITTSVVLLLPKQKLQHSFGFCLKILYVSDCGLFSPPFPHRHSHPRDKWSEQDNTEGKQVSSRTAFSCYIRKNKNTS